MNLLRSVYYRLGPRTRRLARRWVYAPVDLAEKLSGKRQDLVPARGRIFTGRGDFIRAGDELLNQIREHCLLMPDHRILDVGCGIGRMARPLTRYLSQKGSYEGFDIVEEGIRWCRKHYVSWPNFHFQHIPLRNDLYNLETSKTATSFSFPWPENEFDQVILISVFTHMQPAEVAHYLKEIRRVLRAKGHVFASFFLISSEAEKIMNRSPKPFFTYDHGDYMLHNERVRDANIAFRMEKLEAMAHEAGLKIKSIHPGWWPGRSEESCLNFQDIVIFTIP